MRYKWTVADVPKNTWNNFVKSLFWLAVLICLFAAVIVCGIFLVLPTNH
jgi:hypothetical protein